MKTHTAFLVVLLAAHGIVLAAPRLPWSDIGNRMVADTFRAEAARLAHRCLDNVATAQDWEARRGRHREELAEMLSLSPWPAKTDLKPVVTGQLETNDFRVENLHFQSMPGLYVTANLYLPKNIEKPAPTILYLCGHGAVVKEGIPYGNKVTYQHHGAWFARNGYVCLLIDTVQLGEIAGIHHGTHREGMWWWNARGYTSAGVEAWNSIRALDYLSTRPEVDTNRFGVTGRSGGGAYSWWTAALDERVKVAAPVAGITDLQNHVVDGVVEGHCDCMYFVNTYRWDYSQLAAMVAPRPLLIVNTDSDYIFPLDGVSRVHAVAKQLYKLYDAPEKLGLSIGPGPHKDTQDLQVPVFRWFNKHLKNEDPAIEMAALKFLGPEQLKVFKTIPTEERTSSIHEDFVPLPAKFSVPKNASEWSSQRDQWLAILRDKAFAGWPAERNEMSVAKLAEEGADELILSTYQIPMQAQMHLQLYVIRPAKLERPTRLTLRVLDDIGWSNWVQNARQLFGTKGGLASSGEGPANRAEGSAERSGALAQLDLDPDGLTAWFAPRGVGATSGYPDDQKQIHIRRRYMLLGQTQDSMQVWDIGRAIRALQFLPPLRELPLHLTASGNMGCNVLYASLFFGTPVKALHLTRLPASHRRGPDYLNVLRFLDIPQTLAMAAERSPIQLAGVSADDWQYAVDVQNRLGWNRLQLDGPK